MGISPFEFPGRTIGDGDGIVGRVKIHRRRQQVGINRHDVRIVNGNGHRRGDGAFVERGPRARHRHRSRGNPGDGIEGVSGRIVRGRTVNLDLLALSEAIGEPVAAIGPVQSDRHGGERHRFRRRAA